MFWSGVIAGLISITPYSVDAMQSDGARLLLLWRRPAEARAWIALVMLIAEETNGVLPRIGIPTFFALALTSAPELSYVQLLAYNRSLDVGDQAAAPIYLEAALASCASCGRLIRHALFLNAACASVEHRGNVSQARTWIARAARLRKPKPPPASKPISPSAKDATPTPCATSPNPAPFSTAASSIPGSRVFRVNVWRGSKVSAVTPSPRALRRRAL